MNTIKSECGWFSDRGTIKLSSQEEENVQRLLFLVSKAGKINVYGAC